MVIGAVRAGQSAVINMPQSPLVRIFVLGGVQRDWKVERCDYEGIRSINELAHTVRPLQVRASSGSGR